MRRCCLTGALVASTPALAPWWAGLLVTGLEKLIALGALPPLADQLWNTTALLDDSTRVGGFIAAMTGYRAQPALLPLLALAAFWVTMLVSLGAPRGLPKAA